MKKALLDIMFVIGTAPWCIADNYGNLSCLYYTFDFCQMMAAGRLNSVCVFNPHQ